jgi:Protein of unknown function (DUF3592)
LREQQAQKEEKPVKALKAMKILGIVVGIWFLLTGGGLAVASDLEKAVEADVEAEVRAEANEWAKSGFAGPVDGTVQSVDQTSPVTATVIYTDTQGNTHTGQGEVTSGKPLQVGATVSIYYTTSDPGVVVVDVLEEEDPSGTGEILRIAAIIYLTLGSVILLAGTVGLALGKRQPAQLYPPQQPPGQAYAPER